MQKYYYICKDFPCPVFSTFGKSFDPDPDEGHKPNCVGVTI